MVFSKGNASLSIDYPSTWIDVAVNSSPQISLNLFYLTSDKLITSVTWTSINYATGESIDIIKPSSNILDGNYFKFNTKNDLQLGRYLLSLKVIYSGGEYNINKMIIVSKHV